MKRLRPAGSLPLVAVAFLLGGCAVTVVPPANPVEPSPAYILDHGRHASLVVVDSSGRPVRYAFGRPDRENDDIGFFRGLAALLASNGGTLGRRVLPGPATPANILGELGMEIENFHCIAVSRERAYRLQRVLNLVFEQNLASASYDAGWNLEFVQNPEDYWFGDDANEAVKNWLAELDCKVSGVSTFGDWKIRHPSGELPAVCRQPVE